MAAADAPLRVDRETFESAEQRIMLRRLLEMKQTRRRTGVQIARSGSRVDAEPKLRHCVDKKLQPLPRGDIHRVSVEKEHLGAGADDVERIQGILDAHDRAPGLLQQFQEAGDEYLLRLHHVGSHVPLQRTVRQARATVA